MSLSRLATELKNRRQEIEGCASSPDKIQNLKTTELVAALLQFLPRIEKALGQQCGSACLSLSVKHRAFVHAKILGPQPLSNTDAYSAAYPKAKRTTAGTAGEKLMKKYEIQGAISEHERSAAAATVDEKDELAQIMRRVYQMDSSASHRDRIGAGNLRMNMEAGWKAPTKVQVATGDMIAVALLELADLGVAEAQAFVGRFRPGMTTAEDDAILAEARAWMVKTCAAHAQCGDE